MYHAATGTGHWDETSFPFCLHMEQITPQENERPVWKHSTGKCYQNSMLNTFLNILIYVNVKWKMSRKINSNAHLSFSKGIALWKSVTQASFFLFLKVMSDMLALNASKNPGHCDVSRWGHCVLGSSGDSLKISVIYKTRTLAHLGLATTFVFYIPLGTQRK